MKASATLPRARVRDLIIHQLDDETLVYDLETDEARCLNQTAALVWKRCDGKTTVSQAANSMQGELAAPVGTDVILLALKQLQRFHLLETTAKPPTVSRRDLVLKYAPAALALPVIMSITAPTPAQSASCGGQGAPCDTNMDCCSGCSCDGSCFCD